MALITIQLQYNSGDWFEQCAHTLFERFLCKPLSKKRYITKKQLSALLNKGDVETLNWLIAHPTVHGFIINQHLYVHPTVFTRMYMRKVLKTIEKGYALENPMVN